MRRIPVVDIRTGGPRQLAHAYPEQARELIRASRRTFGVASNLASYVALPVGDRLSRDWLARTKNPYQDEIRDVAKTLNMTGVYALNICFEFGCTSAVYAKPGGPVLTRVLDWIFPKLGEHLIVAHQRGQAGDFHNITWPGVSGIFQGIAPGRFAASLNQAPMQRHGLTYAGDWIKNRQRVFRTIGLPPAHLLRQTFEEAVDYDDAKQRLARTPVALPVIFVLAGVNDGEACVIERTEAAHAIRPIDDDRICAANHFEATTHAPGKGWRPRPIDSHGRSRQARDLPLAAVDDHFTWFKPPIANVHTRLAMMACAATGSWSVFGTQGAQPVTGIRRHPD